MPVQSTDLDAFDPSCPLRGAVLCCTSIPPEKRTELAERAEEMGAKHVYDLTSDVTHLIVGEYDTPKYRYVAKERPDVLIIDPSWVDAVRALWIADQKIDLEALEKLHTLPTFASLKISVTGFEDHTERQRITELVQAHGAEYHGNLTKQVTHLLAFRTEGPKYKHATQWGMRIVSVEWLHDSIERGMTLNEKLYHPDIPVEDRGKDAWIRRKLPVARSRKRTRAEDVADEGRRKLRRTASSRLSSMSEKMWGDIMVSGASAVIEQAHAGEWEESKVQADVAQPVGKSDEDTKTSKSIFTNHPRPKKPRALLTGLQFYLYGFSDKRQKRLEEFLPSHDARLAPTLDSLAEENPDIENSYILVPHDLQSSDYPAIPESLSNIPMITEFWVERCYDMKSIQEPSAHILGRPFTRFPIPKFSGLIISSTAFTGFELLHVSKVVELLGAKYDEYLTPKHSVLICASPESMTSAKFNHAQEWKIPVVSAKWLWDSIEAGERLPFRSYLYRVKKTLKETESMTSEGGVDRATNDDSRSNAETEGPVSSSSARDPKTQSFSEHSSDLVPTLPLERNPHTAIEVKAEEDTQFNGSTESLPTQSNKALLTEISGNPTKSDSSIPKLTPPLTSALTAPIPVSREYIDNAISSLLARSKASSNPPLAPESTTTDGKKPLARRRTRILGRATSNVSVASAASIESSVDSTATHGNAVHWPSAKSIHENDDLTKDQEGESRERNDKGVGERESESQPQQSQQLKWEEEESTEYKNRIFKKITGKGSVDDRRGSGGKVKERAVTLGDLNVMPRVNRSGLKMRGGGGGGRVVRNR